MENNFSVYQHITPDNMYYFGATSNIKRRWEGNGKGYKGTTLQPYIEKYGWDNIQHIVLFENQSKEDALSIEDSLIISGWEKGNCINQQRSGLISKEDGYKQQYYERNKEKFKEYQEQNKDKIREYQEQNKDKINEQKRKYYERNKEKFKEYREQNKEQIREYQRQYQREYKEQNKDKIREYNREYHRQYRQRKKLEKQLKEVETTLF